MTARLPFFRPGFAMPRREAACPAPATSNGRLGRRSAAGHSIGSKTLDASGALRGFAAPFDGNGALVWLTDVGASSSSAAVAVGDGGHVFVGGRAGLEAWVTKLEP